MGYFSDLDIEIKEALNIAIDSIEHSKKLSARFCKVINTVDHQKNARIKAQLLLSDIRDGKFTITKKLPITQYNI